MHLKFRFKWNNLIAGLLYYWKLWKRLIYIYITLYIYLYSFKIYFVFRSHSIGNNLNIKKKKYLYFIFVIFKTKTFRFLISYSWKNWKQKYVIIREFPWVTKKAAKRKVRKKVTIKKFHILMEKKKSSHKQLIKY